MLSNSRIFCLIVAYAVVRGLSYCIYLTRESIDSKDNLLSMSRFIPATKLNGDLHHIQDGLQIRGGLLDEVVLSSENVHVRWYNWNSGITQRRYVRDGWCGGIFLLRGQLFVKLPDNDSILLTNEGDYAIYGGVSSVVYQVEKDSIILSVRWKSNYEGRPRNGNVENRDNHKQWIIGSFIDKTVEEEKHLFSENFELKWGLINDVPFHKIGKTITNINNYDWKTMGIIIRGSMLYEFTEFATTSDQHQDKNVSHHLEKPGSFLYWHPNAPHTCSTEEPTLLISLRWRD